ncbi:siderophore-interacting protein [Devriesea agamarum]|uniref:siderophore-interacting protein n=1 Tax=Devriesea agamarum TaxID=472569 RepID=UPI00071D7245|nr:siderophore-interacting protein [Devriesea agamarum]
MTRTRRAIACLDAEVLATRDLSPAFRRITFGGPGLDRFGLTEDVLDLRIKLVVPTLQAAPQTQRFDLPAFIDSFDGEDFSWYQPWLRLPETDRGVMRTYTVRTWRPGPGGVGGEIDVDVVMHTDADGRGGPAAAWAAEARPGDTIFILGPDYTAEGECSAIEFRPGSAEQILLAGDETAVPAMGSILSSLPETARGAALLEVPTSQDILDDVRCASPHMDIVWLPRDGARLGERLDQAVRDLASASVSSHRIDDAVFDGDRTRRSDRRHDGDRCERSDCRHNGGRAGHDGDRAGHDEVDTDDPLLWDVPRNADSVVPRGSAVGDACATSDLYAWIAGESGVVKGIRRYLVRDLGIDRRQVAFMGYWCRGRALS